MVWNCSECCGVHPDLPWDRGTSHQGSCPLTDGTVVFFFLIKKKFIYLFVCFGCSGS